VWIEKQIAMKRFFLLLFLGTCPAVSAQVRFSDYFLEETMRFDYIPLSGIKNTKKGVRFRPSPRKIPRTGYFFSGRAIVSRIDVSAMMFFILYECASPIPTAATAARKSISSTP